MVLTEGSFLVLLEGGKTLMLTLYTTKYISTNKCMLFQV